MSKKFQKVGQNFCEVWMRSVKGKYELQFPFGNIGYCVSIGTDKDSIYKLAFFLKLILISSIIRIK